MEVVIAVSELEVYNNDFRLVDDSKDILIKQYFEEDIPVIPNFNNFPIAFPFNTNKLKNYHFYAIDYVVVIPSKGKHYLLVSGGITPDNVFMYVTMAEAYKWNLFYQLIDNALYSMSSLNDYAWDRICRLFSLWYRWLILYHLNNAEVLHKYFYPAREQGPHWQWYGMQMPQKITWLGNKRKCSITLGNEGLTTDTGIWDIFDDYLGDNFEFTMMTDRIISILDKHKEYWEYEDWNSQEELNYHSTPDEDNLNILNKYYKELIILVKSIYFKAEEVPQEDLGEPTPLPPDEEYPSM